MFTRDDAEPAPHFQTPLLEVGPRECRYIVSESTKDAICCGAPTAEASSWCNGHEQIVFTPRLSERDRQRALVEARRFAPRAPLLLKRAA